MKIKKLNVFKLQREWITQHRNADKIICNQSGEVVQAVYVSPIENWRGQIAADGTVQVPDMDYYNSLKDSDKIKEAIDEMFSRDEMA